jgi:hypothetical protein
MGPEDARTPRLDPDKSRLTERGRPFDYIEALKLSKGAVEALFARVQRGSRRKFGLDLGDDVAGEAVKNLMTANQPLETAPPLHGDRDEAWIRAAAAALANYALSHGAMISAFRAASTGRGLGGTGTKEGGNATFVRQEGDVVDVRPEEDRERFEEANWFQKFWVGFEPEVRRGWVGPDENSRRGQFYEMLLRMAREDGVSPLASGRREIGAGNRFLRGGGERSKGIQLNSAAVLVRLQGAFPNDGWTLQEVQLCWESFKGFVFGSAGAAAARAALGLRPRRKP